MTASVREMELSKQEDTLLSYYSNQVPAHATYVITFGLGFFATLPTILLSRPQLIGYPQWSQFIIYFVLFLVLEGTIIFVFFSYARLLYYNSLIGYLNSLTGIQGRISARYYESLASLLFQNRPEIGLETIIVSLYLRDRRKQTKKNEEDKGEERDAVRWLKMWLERQFCCGKLNDAYYASVIRDIDRVDESLNKCGIKRLKWQDYV